MSRSFGILSTFPPTSCGIATFSAALAAGLIAHGDAVDVVAVADAAPRARGRVGVGAARRRSRRRDVAAAVDVLNGTDVVDRPARVRPLRRARRRGRPRRRCGRSTVPIIVVAHTVLTDPTPHQRAVLERGLRAADAVVVMTETARDRLLAGFDVDPAKVHGRSRTAPPRPADRRPTGRPTRARPSARRRPDLGTARSGQGHRVGDRRDGAARDLRPAPASTSSPARRIRRCASASGESYRRDARSSGPRELGRRRPRSTFDDTLPRPPSCTG